MDDHQVVAKGDSHQTKGKWPESIGLQFPLSVCDITDIGMIDSCHSHVVANGKFLQEKGGGSFPLALGIQTN